MRWIGGVAVPNPAPDRRRPDLCADHGHPGACFNPWLNRTWCLCGEVTYDGDQHTHVACCGGPLIEYRDPDGQYRARAAS